MGKNKKRAQSQKEAQQADRLIKILFAALIIIGVAMLIGFSFMKI